ncbi:unnamed protein product [Mytilus coruscus]|uniref:Uncharacterized protein n=1 Tax=Mytilus coruscus TaxID=42192 RepID=A0A6J8EP97_MYTCO|nr:unnamed protein product [Mytilus coruscus]
MMFVIVLSISYFQFVLPLVIKQKETNSAPRIIQLRKELNILPNDIPGVFNEIKHMLCNDCTKPNNKQEKEICQKKFCKRSTAKISITNDEDNDNDDVDDDDAVGEGKIETYLSKKTTPEDRWPVIFSHLTDMMCQLCRDIKDKKNTNCVMQNCLNPTRTRK